ncbi:hypothetical protein NWE73_08835 [Bdellovibrio sp. PAP01]|uniref:Uncharacterized protein n=2 Tax=Bdellovibrio svalbardensis TaxID=2972972 RepID=A0ABT6DKV7_9BACT|nr:hypothetical protein [Bdellovibrio svalbardensis]
MFLVGCIGYCISQSDDNCMVYFGRGFKTVCGSERNDAYPSLAIVGVMAGGFLIIGLRNLKKKLKAEADEK